MLGGDSLVARDNSAKVLCLCRFDTRCARPQPCIVGLDSVKSGSRDAAHAHTVELAVLCLVWPWYCESVSIVKLGAV